jgi:hypothetical protein
MARMSAHSAEDDFSVAPTGDGFDSLTDDLCTRVKGELESGERLHWAARSEPPFVRFGIAFYVWSVITAILLGLGAVGIVRSLNRERFNDGSEMTLGVVLVVVASMFAIGLIGNWIGRMKRYRNDATVCYAITDRRAIIWTPEPKSNAVRIRTFPRGEIRNLVRVQAPDGSGSLLFAPRGIESTEDFDANWSQDGFRHIRAVRRVEQIVRNNLMNSERFA